MFPLGDDDSDRGGAIPFVTWGLIALNVLAFLLEINRPSASPRWRRCSCSACGSCCNCSAG